MFLKNGSLQKVLQINDSYGTVGHAHKLQIYDGGYEMESFYAGMIMAS